MTIKDAMVEYSANHIGDVVKHTDIVEAISSKHGIKESSIQPADYEISLTTNDNPKVFERIDRGLYKCLGDITEVRHNNSEQIQLLAKLEKDLARMELKHFPSTFLSIIDKTKNEVVISKVLAFLLNPLNTTIKILQGILRLESVGEDELANELDITGYIDDKVTEISLDAGRIDLFFKFDNCWIVIENKIDSFENGEQTERYVECVEQLNGDGIQTVFLYLKPRYNVSQPKNNRRFVVILYEELLEILKRCSIYDFKHRENYMFLEDFITHMEGYIMTKNALEFGKDIEFYMQNKRTLNIIRNSYLKQCYLVKDLLLRKLEEILPEYELYSASGYIQIYKDTWYNDRKNGLHYEVLFPPEIIGRDVSVDIVLHVEKAAKRYADSLAGICKSIEKTVTLDFSDSDSAEESINEIVGIVKKVAKEYTQEIDSLLSGS